MTTEITQLKNKKELTVLAIESSCDETACAIARDGTILSSIIFTQIEIHKQYGGVVPEIASRNHTLNIGDVVDKALKDAGITLDNVDAIAVTYGAGLLGALLVGVSYAKGLAFALNKPLIKVNHIRGHIAANHISNPSLKHPYIALIVSGGHTAVAKVNSFTNMEILGSTTDDAVGEAFDKVARVLGLPYPGGPEIEKLALKGTPNIVLPKSKMKNCLDFSYSGIKTAVINYVHSKTQKGEEINKADVAASFQKTAIDMLVTAAIIAAKTSKLSDIAVAGGVGANNALRCALQLECKVNNFNVYFPTKEMCTDNAAMIAMEATLQIKYGDDDCVADKTLDACSSIPLGAKGKITKIKKANYKN